MRPSFIRSAPRHPMLVAALARSRRAFLGVGIFSGLINVLALAGSLYMLQIYDRVIPSRSVPTLVGLSVLLVGLYAVYGLLDIFRTRIMSRVGLGFDRMLRAPVYSAVVELPLRARQRGDGLQPVRDLDAIRAFLSGPGPTAFFDLPWMPFYLALVYLLHPWLGYLAIGGGLTLLLLAVVTEVRSRAPARAAAESGAMRSQFGETSRRNAEVIRAMGMQGRTEAIWSRLNARFLADQSRAADVASGFGAVTKVLRLLLQSAVLGLGAWLVILGEASTGVMIAASITTARALAPIEIAIVNWRAFLAARQSLARLSALLTALPATPPQTRLPRPVRSLSVHAISVAAPGTTKPLIHNVSFALEAGAGLGLIGPSGSGKSTLARALVGAWQPLPQRGSVRLDGAPLEQYGPEALGHDIGYLSQDLELIDGTIAENIARFDPDARSEDVIAAGKLAGVHDMILNMPEGYDTRVGDSGSALSGGQRQRVALARALYGDPFLVVLDEPNSNLDLPGDMALAEAIKAVRSRGGIVVVVAHRPTALASLDQLLVMSGGQVQAFGPKEEILRKVMPPGSQHAQPATPPSTTAPPAPAASRQAASLKVVSDKESPQ